MERAALEVEGLAGLARALLPSAQSTEVFRCLGSHICTKLHGNAAGSSTADGHVLMLQQQRKTIYPDCYQEQRTRVP